MEANLSLMYVISLFSVLIAFAFAAYLFLWVRRQKSTNARINEVAALIKEGANTFMRKEYRVLSIFAGIAAVIIFLLLPSPVWTGHPGRNLSMAAAYVAGTALSAIAGKIGILVATNANARAAEGARQGVRAALQEHGTSRADLRGACERDFCAAGHLGFRGYVCDPRLSDRARRALAKGRRNGDDYRHRRRSRG